MSYFDGSVATNVVTRWQNSVADYELTSRSLARSYTQGSLNVGTTTQP